MTPRGVDHVAPLRATDGTAARLRHDIDTGRTGDKIDWSDAAAAPLGTDEEAVGAPPTSAAVEHARTLEAGRDGDVSHNQNGIGVAWVLIALVASLAAAAVDTASIQLADPKPPIDCVVEKVVIQQVPGRLMPPERSIGTGNFASG